MIKTLLVNQLYPNTKLKVKKKKTQNFTLQVQGQQGGMIPTQETKMLHEKKRTKSSLRGILHVCSWHVISSMSALGMHHLK